MQGCNEERSESERMNDHFSRRLLTGGYSYPGSKLDYLQSKDVCHSQKRGKEVQQRVRGIIEESKDRTRERNKTFPQYVSISS
jgi:hypothetical protein